MNVVRRHEYARELEQVPDDMRDKIMRILEKQANKPIVEAINAIRKRIISLGSFNEKTRLKLEDKNIAAFVRKIEEDGLAAREIEIEIYERAVGVLEAIQ